MVKEGWLKVFKDYFRHCPKQPHDEILSEFDTCGATKSNRCFVQYIYANLYKNRHMFKRHIDVKTMLLQWVDVFEKGVWEKPEEWDRWTLAYFYDKVERKGLIDKLDDWNTGTRSVFVTIFENIFQIIILSRNAI